MTEREFMAALVQLARLLNYLVYHTHDSRHSAAGFPDLCMVRGERVIFAELKSEKGQLTADQERWLTALREAGQEVYLWRPSQYDEAIDILKSARVGAWR